MKNPVKMISDWFGRKTTQVALSLANEALVSWVRQSYGGGSTITGKVISDESAMRVTTAFACVRVIAETLGEVTLAVFERQKNGNAEKVEHDIGTVLIEQPNADMTGMIFREANGTNLAARGNAYAMIERGGTGQLASLYPIPASKCSVKRDSSTNWERIYEVRDRGKMVQFPSEKIWHWKGFGYNGIEGLSPIGCAREALGLALAGEEFNSRLFANGLYPSIVLKPSVNMKPDQVERAEERIQKLHASLLNAGKPYMLPPGTEIAEGIFAPRDAQFLELRQMQIPELCRIWRISPHMVADLARATNNNIEQLSLEFIMYTMMPYFRRIEEEARQLFRPADRKRFFVRFNFESLLRADSQARAQLYSILLQNGVYSRNEVRALENRNRIDDPQMDAYTVQSNMISVDDLRAVADAMRAKLIPSTSSPTKNIDDPVERLLATVENMAARGGNGRMSIQ